MIIWGSTGRELKRSSGDFYCPDCDAEQGYDLYRVATYFTLYFIPLFETAHHGNYVKCQNCDNKYNETVLDYEPPTDAERLLHSVAADLSSGTPVQMTRTKLLNSGIEVDLADRVITMAVGENQILCESCSLSYIEGVKRCSGCGAQLAH